MGQPIIVKTQKHFQALNFAIRDFFQLFDWVYSTAFGGKITVSLINIKEIFTSISCKSPTTKVNADLNPYPSRGWRGQTLHYTPPPISFPPPLSSGSISSLFFNPHFLLSKISSSSGTEDQKDVKQDLQYIQFTSKALKDRNFFDWIWGTKTEKLFQHCIPILTFL